MEGGERQEREMDLRKNKELKEENRNKVSVSGERKRVGGWEKKRTKQRTKMCYVYVQILPQ